MNEEIKKTQKLFCMTKLYNGNKPYKFCISARNADKLKELYIIIKCKRDNARNDLLYNRTLDSNKILELRGEVCAYNDVLSLLESAKISPTINFNKKDE